MTDNIHVYISNYHYQYFCQESWQGTSVRIDTILVCHTKKDLNTETMLSHLIILICEQCISGPLSTPYRPF